MSTVTRFKEETNDELDAVLDGLGQPQKTISSKYFYDEPGSVLFEEITRLPEYYLTDTELGIMQEHVAEMADRIGPCASLIEFGSGASRKIRLFLDHLHEPAVYVPVDISGEFLAEVAATLAKDYPDLEILPVAADFTRPFALPNPKIMPKRNIVYFPGSTIGNFSPEAAVSLLKVMHHEAGDDGGLLIGIDLQKDRKVIERAYNDAAGVTARFNLNILQSINDRFDADFDLAAFEHEAIYNEEAGRIEMYLRSLRDQIVTIDEHQFALLEGERIHTENSHKHTLAGFNDMLSAAGFAMEQVWTDANEWFAVIYCTR